MNIQNSTIEDIDEIFRLYNLASSHQRSLNMVTWPEFERSLIETEIKENRQWKLLIDDEVACVWAITFSDPEIWEDKNSDSSIYIHRIATNPDFRGNNLVNQLTEWSKKYAAEIGKRFIRLDTVGENKKLISIYKNAGFDFLGLFKLENTESLPAHYLNATVSLFEIDLEK